MRQRSFVAIDREVACDELVLYHAKEEERKSYGQTIIKLLEWWPHGAAIPGGVGILEDKDQMKHRLRRIVRFRKARLWSWFGLVTALVLALVSLTDAQTERRGNASKTKEVRTSDELASVEGRSPGSTNEASRSVLLRVFDADATGVIAGAKVELDLQSGDQRTSLDKSTTDAGGNCRLSLPAAGPESVKVTVRMTGFLSVEVNWDMATRRSLPSEIPLPLYRGIAIGGVVKNEEGKLVPDATIRLTDVERRYLGPNSQFNLAVTEARSDAEGRWTMGGLPGSLRGLKLQVAHLEYVIADGVQLGGKQLERRDFLNNQAVLTLRRRYLLAGKVISGEGMPIADALVMAQSWDTAPYVAKKNATTDKAGRFQIADVMNDRNPPHGTAILVQAKGFAPEHRTVQLRPGMEELIVRLSKGNTLRGVVVDIHDKPIDSVYISADSFWLSARVWEGRTDASGRFVWDSAPADGARLSFFREGYREVFDEDLRADGSEQRIVLRLAGQPKISGTVIDKMSKTPVQTFEVRWNLTWDGTYRRWPNDKPLVGTNGEYQMTVDLPTSQLKDVRGILVEVKAARYKPAVSRLIHVNERDVALDFELERGDWPSGAVQLPNGEPAVGAEVIPVIMTNRWDAGPTGSLMRDVKFVTDDRGCFLLEPKEDAFERLISVDSTDWLRITHEQGYAEVSVASLATVTNVLLKPLGRIEGTVLSGKNPVSGQRVTLNGGGRERRFGPIHYLAYSADTDSVGHFVVERMCPGEYHLPGFGTVTIKPGETTRVTLGGGGRTVTGQVVLSNKEWSIDWQHCRAGWRGNPWSNGEATLYPFLIDPDGKIVAKNLIGTRITDAVRSALNRK